MMELYNDNCFNILPKIEDKTIDLFVLDLPYANKDFGKCTACKWDNTIDLDKMWVEIKRIMKPNAVILFYCNTKFGFSLIKSNMKWFRYDLIWKKSRKVGFLSANKMPLKQHENIYVFKEKGGTYNPQKTEGTPYKKKENKIGGIYGNVINTELNNKGDRHPTSIIEHENVYVFGGLNEDNDELINYSKQILKYIGKTKTEIKKNIKDADHFFRYSKDNFSMATKETYNKLIELYKINDMKGFIDYETLKEKGRTYNPQKTKGEPYKTKESSLKDSYYRGSKKEYKSTANENKGDRHPTSIIEHENIYVFSDDNKDDLDNSRNKELRAYAEKVKKYIGKTKTEIVKKIGQTIDHFLRIKSTQFAIPTEETYNKLIEIYKINEMEGFMNYETVKSLWEKETKTTYNPQKTEGTPYKTIGKGTVGVYNSKRIDGENKGDRHPTSIYPDTIETTILEHNNPHKTLHRTQKPLSLCEWLIKTYSNEGDIVMDFTMGSGTTGEACINTKRKFIGVEMDKEIFEIAKKRLM